MARNKPQRKSHTNSLHSAIIAKLNRAKNQPSSTPTKTELSETQPASPIETPPPHATDLKRQKLESDQPISHKKAKYSSKDEKRVEPDQQEAPHVKQPDQEEEESKQGNGQKIEKLIQKHSQKIKDDPSKLISEFHRIEKRLSQRTLDPLTRHKLLVQQKRLGGLEAYQTASKIGGALERGGETGKWCAQALVQLALRPTRPQKLKLLDVGAIDGKSYDKYQDWISATCIDINPIDESVVARCDFFKFPLPKSREEQFDVVCLSLVLNFVGDLKKRGEMIKRARRLLKPSGTLFIVLPLACLSNSRYLDFHRFRMIINYLGFKVIKQHNSSKLTYWLLEKVDHTSQANSSTGNKIEEEDQDNLTNSTLKTGSSLKFPKVQIRTGLSRNNFCIKV
ncbi:hypothetical protein PCANC_20435 [Puccinia coronata f. sp. avenae]|uniref:25S rRNA adenine-N(1) methyltransferase n=1 Tax=Puccinia coronata f. sp. avenae TaxID=200324 RepID=A0A2N5U6I9_9BASI|nr:hypothetical protein PCANC_20435 [Puccinia coronata f. sp. avenae]PLW33371.1 hypothetical protein PCASD_13028 [Puccinia coronata f. sp. avenae]